jgi:hypothetical protein
MNAEQPTVEDTKLILADLTMLKCPSPLSATDDDIRRSPPTCMDRSFDLATALVFNNINPEKGLDIYRALGRAGHVDGMVASGILLTDGFGVEINDVEGVEWIKLACKKGSVQAHFELGSLLYRGIPGVIEMDEMAAIPLFEKAAAANHIGLSHIMLF